jgi:3',5'-cyclic AMP phosphodiesterase CpdA
LETPAHERIICITGDFAVTGSSEELDRAQQFLKDLYEGLEWSLENARSRIVIIPGNHDLEWSKPDVASRWQTWRVFVDDFYGTKSPRGDALAWVRLVRIEAARVAFSVWIQNITSTRIASIATVE